MGEHPKQVGDYEPHDPPPPCSFCKARRGVKYSVLHAADCKAPTEGRTVVTHHLRCFDPKCDWERPYSHSGRKAAVDLYREHLTAAHFGRTEDSDG